MLIHVHVHPLMCHTVADVAVAECSWGSICLHLSNTPSASTVSLTCAWATIAFAWCWRCACGPEPSRSMVTTTSPLARPAGGENHETCWVSATKIGAYYLINIVSHNLTWFTYVWLTIKLMLCLERMIWSNAEWTWWSRIHVMFNGQDDHDNVFHMMMMQHIQGDLVRKMCSGHVRRLRWWCWKDRARVGRSSESEGLGSMSRSLWFSTSLEI